MSDFTTSLDTMDVPSIAADIGAELFSSGEKSAPTTLDANTDTGNEIDASLVIETPPAQEAVVEASKTPDPRVEPGQNSVVDQPLPKSWKKDMEAEWKTLTPAVRDYVYKREADVMRGIQQYQSGYQAWDSLIKPFVPLLQANPDINPIQLMQGLMNTHMQLLNPNSPMEGKVQLINALLGEYGIQLNPGDQTPADERSAREIQTLRQELNEVKRYNQQRQAEARDSDLQRHVAIVTAFEQDPKNKYFSEVGQDIMHYISTGAATDLPKAYELACWANPAVRAKMLAEQQASAPATKPRNEQTGRFVNLDDGSPAPRKIAKPTLDNTIDGVVAKHYPKAH